MLLFSLQMLRSRCGDDQDTSQPSQNISIVVSDPQRTRQGLSMIISSSTTGYTISTIVRQDRRYFGGPNDEDNIKEYSVTRSHSNIKSLYKCLIREYRKSGVIVPPPPKGLSKVYWYFKLGLMLNSWYCKSISVQRDNSQRNGSMVSN